MKKMMIMAVAILAAVVSQAIGLEWSVAGLKSYAGGTAYLFNTADTSTDAISELLTAGNVKDATDKAWGTSIAIADATLTKNPAGAIADGGNGIEVAAGAKNTAFVALLFTDDKGNQQFAVTPTLEKTAPELGNVIYAFGNVSNKITWNTVGNGGGGGGDDPIIPDVPEPTSMALLALGAAAFGLRRKFSK